MKQAGLRRVRQLLWLYFWLLIFEGALRKWILPGLSNPLLLVRDPVALLALYWGLPLLRQKGSQIWLLLLVLIGTLSLLLAVSVGHGDLFIALYGSRIFLIQLPMIFLFAAAFNRDDVISFAWVLLMLSIPMAILIAIQSNLPESHWLNVAPGGFGSAVFAGAAGRFRPPGTFTFVSGVNSFFTLAAASLLVLLYGTPINKRGRLFSVVACIALVVALPVSISRTLLAGYLQVTAALFVTLLLSRSKVLPLVYGLLALVLAVWIGSTLPQFREASEAFATRWESAAAIEAEDTDSALSSGFGVFEQRVIGGFTRPFFNLEAIPIGGYGIGIGSNVGSQRIAGELKFQVGEGAWESSLAEMGLPLGLSFILWRLSLAFWIVRLALRSAVKSNRLPLILTGACFLVVLSGQVNQPTGLGFLVFSAGLTLAACRNGVEAYGPRP